MEAIQRFVGPRNSHTTGRWLHRADPSELTPTCGGGRGTRARGSVAECIGAGCRSHPAGRADSSAPCPFTIAKDGQRMKQPRPAGALPPGSAGGRRARRAHGGTIPVRRDQRIPPPTDPNATPRSTPALHPTGPPSGATGDRRPAPPPHRAHRSSPADTEIASVVPGQPGQPTQVTITSGLGGQLAIASYVRLAPPSRTSRPPLAGDRVPPGLLDRTTRGRSTPCPPRIRRIRGCGSRPSPVVQPNTRMTTRDRAQRRPEIMVRAITIPSQPTDCGRRAAFSIATGSPRRAAEPGRPIRTGSDGGVPEMVGWDNVGPVRNPVPNPAVTPRPEHGHARASRFHDRRCHRLHRWYRRASSCRRPRADHRCAAARRA